MNMKQSLLIRHLRPLLMTVLAVVAGAVPCTSLADTANDTGSSATTSNETDAKKATATFSADGSTLVITASGDITDYTSTVQTPVKRTFTNAAATKITTQQNTSSFVKAGDEYYTYTTYYEANVKYTQVASSDVSTYISGPSYAWRSDVKTTLGGMSMYSVTYDDGVWKANSKESDFNWLAPNKLVYIFRRVMTCSY